MIFYGLQLHQSILPYYFVILEKFQQTNRDTTTKREMIWVQRNLEPDLPRPSESVIWLRV